MVVFIFFGAAALEVAMRPAVLWLEARGLRRWLGVLLVYALLLALIVLLIWLTAPSSWRRAAPSSNGFPTITNNCATGWAVVQPPGAASALRCRWKYR